MKRLPELDELDTIDAFDPEEGDEGTAWPDGPGLPATGPGYDDPLIQAHDRRLLLRFELDLGPEAAAALVHRALDQTLERTDRQVASIPWRLGRQYLSTYGDYPVGPDRCGAVLEDPFTELDDVCLLAPHDGPHGWESPGGGG